MARGAHCNAGLFSGVEKVSGTTWKCWHASVKVCGGSLQALAPTRRTNLTGISNPALLLFWSTFHNPQLTGPPINLNACKNISACLHTYLRHHTSTQLRHWRGIHTHLRHHAHPQVAPCFNARASRGTTHSRACPDACQPYHTHEQRCQERASQRRLWVRRGWEACRENLVGP